VPLVASFNFVSDLFGWSGKPLDSVNDVLLQAYGNPPVQNNVQNGPPIYALDSSGVLHHVIGGDLNRADFSWREVIAVRQSVIDSLSKGGDITNRNQIQPIGRPLDAAALRQAFGNDITFKLGNSNDFHFPSEVGYVWVTGMGWLGPDDPRWAEIRARGVRLGL
jgi:hypothetical protein